MRIFAEKLTQHHEQKYKVEYLFKRCSKRLFLALFDAHNALVIFALAIFALDNTFIGQ